MRAASLIAAFAAISAPALAQQQQKVNTVESRQRGDTMVRIILERRSLTPGEVRSLKGELMKLSEKVNVLSAQLQREGSTLPEARARAMREDLQRAILEHSRAQTQLVFGCATLRPRAPGEDEGYIGVNLKQESTALIRAGSEIETERFSRVPEIGTVETDSPAEKAGVRPGDMWMAVDGRPLVNMLVEDLQSTLRPGLRVELRVRRDGRELDLPTLVANRYPSEVCEDKVQMFTITPFFQGQTPVPVPPRSMSGPGSTSFVFTSPSYININGATFLPLTNAKREAFVGVQKDEGVVVDAVAQGSPADIAGLREYDVVVRLNGELIGSLSDLMRLTTRPAGGLSFSVVRKGETRTVVLK